MGFFIALPSRIVVVCRNYRLLLQLLALDDTACKNVLPALLAFDEKTLPVVSERGTVYNGDRLVYSLKDGTEITVMF